MYYSTDGSVPTTDSTVYFSPITINSNTTIKYFAVDQAGNTEQYKTAIYTIQRIASIITGAGPGGGPHIRVFDYQGNARSEPNKLYAFDRAFKGGINVAACDTDGDNIDEIVAGAGTGGGPWVRVFEVDGSLMTQFMTYDRNMKGGVEVACGDLNGNGREEIITGVSSGYGPHVRVFDGLDGSVVITNGFFAYSSNVKTGVRVAAGDLDGDGIAEIITGTGDGAGTQVRTFTGDGQAVFSPGFFVYSESSRTGIEVAAGDIDGDGNAEIITGSGNQRIPLVKVYDYDGSLIDWFFAYSVNYRKGVRVSAGDVDGDGVDEIITGTKQGGGPQVRVFEMDGAYMDDFFAYDSRFGGGVDVAGGYIDL